MNNKADMLNSVTRFSYPIQRVLNWKWSTGQDVAGI